MPKIRTRSKRVARRSLRDFLGAPRRVVDPIVDAVSPTRRRIKRRLKRYVGPR